jgi:hypothetical protein
MTAQLVRSKECRRAHRYSVTLNVLAIGKKTIMRTFKKFLKVTWCGWFP